MKIAKQKDGREILKAAHDWRTLLSMPDVPQDQLDRFQAWIEADERHESAYDRAVTVYQALGSLSVDDLGDDLMKPAWRERLPNFLFSAVSGHPVGRLRVAAAAAFVIVVTGTLFTLGNRPDRTVPEHPVQVARHATETGEIRNVTLIDGTVVTLGAQTAIEVTMSGRRRQTELSSGAALFDVKPDADRPFAVTAGNLTATAVGTRFDVRHNGDVARVAVADGEVRVTYPRIVGGNPSSLTATASLLAGQQVAATSSEGLRGVERIAVDTVGVWRTKRLAYSGATLAELVADARRHSSTVITIRDANGVLDEARVTAFFDGDDIDAMIATIPDILPVEIHRTESGAIEIHPLPQNLR